jgi:hypothetical protein
MKSFLRKIAYLILPVIVFASCEVHIEDNHYHSVEDDIVGAWVFDQVLLDEGLQTTNITYDYHNFVLTFYSDKYAKLKDTYTGQTFTGDWDIYHVGNSSNPEHRLHLDLYDSFSGNFFRIEGLNLEIGGVLMYFDEEFAGDYYIYRLERF